MRIIRSTGTGGTFVNTTSTTDSLTDSACSGSSGSKTLSATNSFTPGQIIFIYQARGTGAGFGEFNQVDSYISGTVTTVYSLERDYVNDSVSRAHCQVVERYAGFFNQSYLYGKAWDQNAGGLFVKTVSGTFWNKAGSTIDLKGRGYLGGSSASYGGGAGQGECGEGWPNGKGYTQSSNGNGGGGGKKTASGGGINSGGGGGGANSTAGGNGGNIYGATTGGFGGSVVGGPDFQTYGIFMGGGGGASVGSSTSGEGLGGNGGAIAIIICDEFINDGTIDLSGNGNTDPGHGSNQDGDGAPGAGGSLWIIAKKVSGSGTILGLDGYRDTGGTIGFCGGAGVGRFQIDVCAGTLTSNPSIISNLGGHDFCAASSLNFIM